MKKVISDFIVIISVVFVAISVIIDITPNIMLDTKYKLIIYIFSMLMIYINMKIKNSEVINEENKIKNRRKSLTLILIIYSILISTLLFLDTNYRRDGINQNIDFFSKEHITYYSNLVPFKTIYGLINKTITGNLNTKILITNIVGNIIVFAPFGILIPLIFNNKVIKLKKFILLMVVIVLLVESIQFVTMKGTFDIDDLILNVLGAVFTFIIAKTKSSKVLIYKIIE